MLLLVARRLARDREGGRSAAGAMGVLWAPVAVLIPAALEPSAPVEYATIALVCLLLGRAHRPLGPGRGRRSRPAIAALLALPSSTRSPERSC